jgi:hypothetical protein
MEKHSIRMDLCKEPIFAILSMPFIGERFKRNVEEENESEKHP